MKHLPHIDEAPLSGKVEGTRHAIHQLHSLVHNTGDVHSTVKYDGSPSYVATNKDGKFTIATKSAFNKTPKINTSDADIEANHGHAPGLVTKLKEGLQHLHKIHKPGTTTQGDIMFGEHDKKIETIYGKPHYVFTPNTITYKVPVDSEEGKKIGKAKIGVAVHSMYDEKGNRHPIKDGETNHHSDVYQFPIKATLVQHSKDTKAALSDAGREFQSTPKEAFNTVADPKIHEHIQTYINKKVAGGEGDKLHSDELLHHIHSRFQKEIDSLKTSNGKQRKIANRDEILSHVAHNKKDIDKIFTLTNKINTVKHMVIDTMDRASPFKHFVGDQPTKPEGYVVTSHSGSSKLVNRGEFSKLNFLKSKNR